LPEICIKKEWGAFVNRLKSRFLKGIFGTGWKNIVISVFLAIGVFFSSKLYALLNHGPNVIFLKTPLDDFLPVVPLFVIPYISLEPFIYLTLVFLLLFRTRLFQSAALSMITVWLISYAFYFFLQSYVARPALSGGDLFTRLILRVYSSDNPYNDFPSLHTSLSTILAIHLRKADKRIGFAVAAWATLIVPSTVFIKQHYAADLAGGLVLAFSVSLLFLKILPKKQDHDC
jgi:membrane-associated phospholipid phosphatase